MNHQLVLDLRILLYVTIIGLLSGIFDIVRGKPTRKIAFKYQINMWFRILGIFCFVTMMQAICIALIYFMTSPYDTRLLGTLQTDIFTTEGWSLYLWFMSTSLAFFFMGSIVILILRGFKIVKIKPIRIWYYTEEELAILNADKERFALKHPKLAKLFYGKTCKERYE